MCIRDRYQPAPPPMTTTASASRSIPPLPVALGCSGSGAGSGSTTGAGSGALPWHSLRLTAQTVQSVLIAPVSYTHLDVYKRQGLCCKKLFLLLHRDFIFKQGAVCLLYTSSSHSVLLYTFYCLCRSLLLLIVSVQNCCSFGTTEYC